MHSIITPENCTQDQAQIDFLFFAAPFWPTMGTNQPTAQRKRASWDTRERRNLILLPSTAALASLRHINEDSTGCQTHLEVFQWSPLRPAASHRPFSHIKIYYRNLLPPPVPGELKFLSNKQSVVARGESLWVTPKTCRADSQHYFDFSAQPRCNLIL